MSKQRKHGRQHARACDDSAALLPGLLQLAPVKYSISTMLQGMIVRAQHQTLALQTQALILRLATGLRAIALLLNSVRFSLDSTMSYAVIKSCRDIHERALHEAPH